MPSSLLFLLKLQNRPAQTNPPAASTNKTHVHQPRRDWRSYVQPRLSRIRRVQDRPLLSNYPSTLFVDKEDVAHLELISNLPHLLPGLAAVGSPGDATASAGNPYRTGIAEEDALKDIIRQLSLIGFAILAALFITVECDTEDGYH